MRQNVKKPSVRRSKKQAVSPQFERTTFTTPRTMDFFSEKELVTQTGHERADWPLVVVKELVDNALDACDESDITPQIDVAADACGITVKDNGPGLPEATLSAALDFNVRASNREGYVAPDRGAQGNALMTLIALPYVVDQDAGEFIVETDDKRHVITCRFDPISQQPVVADDVSSCSVTGTKTRVQWTPNTDEAGDVVWPFGPRYRSGTDSSIYKRVLSMLDAFALFNPHASFHLNWFGETKTWEASDPTWTKWKPNKPTSPHWYDLPHLKRLIGGYITHDSEQGKDRLVSNFLAEFDGLTGSQKRTQVLDETGLKRAKLSTLVANGEFDMDRIAALLAAMQKFTRPIQPPRLGIIGEPHLKARLLDMGVTPESFNYTKILDADGLPSVVESAFGWLGDSANDERKIFTGANWSAAIKNPFRSFGATGEGLEAQLSDLRVGAHEPVVFVLHVVQPRLEYTDRGKSALVVAD